MSEFFAGAISGITQCFSGHPFDTVKVLKQNNKSYKNLTFKGYYRGISYPLLSNTIINSVVFGSYETINRKINNTFFSGFFAGGIISPIVYAFEVGKVKRQTKQTIRIQDFWRTKGKLACFGRESLSFTTYFWSFNLLKDNGYHPLIGGAVAGILNWGTTYPLDVIRNRQMVQNIDFIKAFKQGNLLSGFGVCMMRAVIVNSIGFYVYDYLTK